MVGAATLQCFAAVSHLNRFVRSYFAAVPLVSFVLVQQLGTRGDQDLVGRLSLVAFGVIEHPEESR